MERFKRILAALLVLCMFVSVVPMNTLAAEPEPAPAAATDVNMKILHLDCGRKYFSADWIKALITEMAADGYTHLQLAFGNDGLRFLLDDMAVCVGGKDYSSQEVSDKIKEGNNQYYEDPTGNALTQTEMDEIIAHAKEKKIEIIPLLNTPGHMDALLHAANTLLGDNVAFGTWKKSKRTVDITNQKGVEFTQAVVQKYIEYFASKDCEYFNIGADEYANDVYTSGGMGFGELKRQGRYGRFVDYLNSMIHSVKDAGMIPMAFNDGVYYDQDASNTIDSSLVVQYWSSGWSGYNLASARYLAEKNFQMVNFNGSHYYVLGKNDVFDSGYQAAKTFSNTVFADGHEHNPFGSAFAIWCDFPNVETEQQIAEKVRLPMRAMALSMEDRQSEIDSMNQDEIPGGFKADGSIDKANPDPSPEHPQPADETREITVPVGEQVTDTIEGFDYTSSQPATNQHVRVTCVKQSGTTSDEPVSQIKSGAEYLIKNKDNQKKPYLTQKPYNSFVSGLEMADAKGTLWTITENGTGYTIQSSKGTYLNIGKNSAKLASESQTITLKWDEKNQAWTISQDQYALTFTEGVLNQYAIGKKEKASSANQQWELCQQNTSANTKVIFTGLVAGETTVKIGHVTYKVHVVNQPTPPPVPTEDYLTIEYWITNSRIYNDATHSHHSSKVSSSDVNTEEGKDIITLVPVAGYHDKEDQSNYKYWRTRLLDRTTNEQTTQDGVDQTLEGVGVTKIRYWDNQWSVYTENKVWVAITPNYQLAAYYMNDMQLANEVQIGTADWGKKGDGTLANQYLGPDHVSIAFQVIYEDGTTAPASTSAADLANYTYLVDRWKPRRGVGTIGITQIGDFQIWKVTAETGTHKTEYKDTYQPVVVMQFTWDKNEKTVYEGEPVSNYTIVNPAKAPSTEGAYANLTWDEKNDAILVRIYLKTVKTEDSLTVHYLDNNRNGEEFYQYNISVNSGTVFNEQFSLNEEYTDINQALIHNTVLNSKNVSQTVSADLKTMPEIQAKYRYSSYRCVQAERSSDGKEVFLHYDFNNAHHYVIDFGTPLHIMRGELGIDGGQGIETATIHDGQFGTVQFSGMDTLIYTPQSVLQSPDQIQLDLHIGDSIVTHYIYIHPASNVLYEENVMTTQGTRWQLASTSTSNPQSSKNEAAYGYDQSYASSQGANGVYTATLDPQEMTDKPLTFQFTGTGLDVIGSCGANTGFLVARISQNNQTVKSYIVDTSFNDSSISGMLNQVPLIHVDGLMLGEYQVDLNAANPTMTKNVATMAVGGASAGFALYDMLIDMGMTDEEIENAEYIGMDDVLGASTYAMTDEVVSAGTGNAQKTVSVDGIRVYRPTNDTAYVPAERNLNYTNVMDEKINGNFSAYVELDSQSGKFDTTNYEKLGGPENELYLKNGTGIVFGTDATHAQVSLRAVSGATEYNQQAISHNTEMYYEIDVKDGMITIANTGNELLAIGNLKTNGNITTIRNVDEAVQSVAAFFVMPEPASEFEVRFDLSGTDFAWADGAAATEVKSFIVSEAEGGVMAPTVTADGAKLAGWEAVEIETSLADREILTSQYLEENFDWTNIERIVTFRPVVEKAEPEVNNDFLVFFELDSRDYSWTDETPNTQIKQFTVTEEDGGIFAPEMNPGKGNKLVSWKAVDQDLTLTKREILTVQAMEDSADWSGKERIVIFRPVVEKVFAPEHFDIQLTVEKGYSAKYVNVNVEADDAVDYITVNGKRIDANNADWVEFGFDPYLIFVTNLELGRNDTVEIEIVAYDQEGNASEVFLARE